MGDENLDWNDLRYFLAAAKEKTLAGAARSLGVEHSTVGRRLATLEKALGGALFVRGPEGLRPTPLAERLTPFVDEVERSVRAVHDAAFARKTRIRLAAPTGFTRVFLPAIQRLASDHPEVELEIASGSRPADLLKGEADIAIRSGPVVGDALIARRLCESGFAAYVSGTYRTRHPGPIDPDDLAGHELIGFDSSLTTMPAARWIEERATRATIVMRSRELVEMCSAAVNGVGIAVLPCVLGDAEPNLERVTPDVVATRPLSLVYRRDARLSSSLQAVIQFVTEVILENAERIGCRPLGSR